MPLPKRYDAQLREPELAEQWESAGVYHFEKDGSGPLFSVDTPPPTVSGHLHLGHVFSYAHTDFMARFWRMNGYRVFYPMGFDDNGLPTERLVERWEGLRAGAVSRDAFIERCLAVSEREEEVYAALWRRLGLSVDWRYSYRTIDEEAQRLAQWSFIDLYEKELLYRQQAPTIWCPECRTAIAQADVDDMERTSTFYTLAFRLDNGSSLAVATTRPELLPACVAVFVNPEDPRAAALAGHTATVPLFGQQVPILVDPAADPEKGTGIVMCCTFGDSTDVAWWFRHELPLVEAVDRDGRLREPAGDFAGMTVAQGRSAIVTAARAAGLLLGEQPTPQTVRVHERCDTPVEYIVTSQWFVSVLDNKEVWLEAGDRIQWHPGHMQARYRQWVENLAWDWCISRQRYFGVPFPVWYCASCDAVLLPPQESLPVDPRQEAFGRACPTCGSEEIVPEEDVMDTWATSSLSPQIVGRFFDEPSLYRDVFPFTLRPQAHEIIRTWAFYTIVKSHYHFGHLPWTDVAISGWGLAPEGSGKISKSRGGGPVSPDAMLDRYSADAVRYWAASTGFGKDSVIDEEKIQAGAKLVNKLWNVARFSERFLHGYTPGADLPAGITPADRWLLSRTQRLIARVSERFRAYDYASAKSEIEVYFWTELADNYLEMAKKRLYDGGVEADGARYTLRAALLTTLKLLAPLLPYVTEAIFQGLFPVGASLHGSRWPSANTALASDDAEAVGAILVTIASDVRRVKSEHGLSLGAAVTRLHLSSNDPWLQEQLRAAEADLASITRAVTISVSATEHPDMTAAGRHQDVTVALTL